MYTMRLRSVGNPDFGQYAPVSDPEVVTGSTLVELRAAAQAYIDKWDLGGGNWISPVVKQGSKIVGHFSYNLRFWEGRPGRWDAACREIQITDGVKAGVL
jgi:hypothetical protein